MIPFCTQLSPCDEFMETFWKDIYQNIYTRKILVCSQNKIFPLKKLKIWA